MTTGQYVSVPGAAKKLNVSEQLIIELANKLNIRLYRGSLGQQMTNSDFERLSKEAATIQYAKMLETGGRALKPTAPTAPVATGNPGGAPTVSGKNAAVVTPSIRSASGKSNIVPPVSRPGSVMAAPAVSPANAPATKDTSPTGDAPSDELVPDLFETSDGDAAGADLDALLAKRLASGARDNNPSESGELFFGNVLAELSHKPKPTERAGGKPAMDIDDDGPKTTIMRPMNLPPTPATARPPVTAGREPSGRAVAPIPAEHAHRGRAVPADARSAEPTERPPAVPADAEPLSVGRTRHLLWDDILVDSMSGLTREWHRPTKLPGNPVLLPDTPWELGGYSVLCGSVLHDPEENLFKMWYHTQGQLGRAVGYATSVDGIHWQKPNLDIVAYDSKPTNLVMAHPQVACYAELLGVARHPEDKTSGYRSAFVYIDSASKNRGIKTAVSPDGLHWRADDKITIPGIAGVGHLIRDETTNNYVIYGRGSLDGRRVVQRIESADFENWSEPEVVLTTDETDPAGDDLYSMSVLNYGRSYIGLLQMFHGQPECLIDVQFAFSHDGKTWHRPWREPFLPLGAPGEWDRFNTSVGAGKIIRVARKELWFFYGGRTFRHPQYKGEEIGINWGAVGLAKLRVDGFASLNSGFREGTLTTRPLVIKYPNLTLNVYSPFGEVRVSVLDVAGQPVPGMTSDPIIGDHVDKAVTWPGGKSLTPYLKKPIRLLFTLRNAKIFSLWSQG